MQFGGDDQWSNMLGGTELIRRKLGKDANAMTITLLTDSHGKKMGKTAGNAVWLDPAKTSPYELSAFSGKEELKNKNAAVTAILPGAMPTRDDIKEQIKGQGLWGRLAAKSPQSVAEHALKAVRKNKAKTIVGFWNKMMRVATAWLPQSWKMKFIARRWSKIFKDAF